MNALSLSDLELKLTPVLTEIETKRHRHLAMKRLILPTAREFCQEIREDRWKIVSSLAWGSLPLIILHPIIVGTSACLSAYRVEDWTDVYSSNMQVADNASQLYSNLGHAIGYVVEGVALTFLSGRLIFKKSYDRALFNRIGEIYNPAIENPERTIEEKNFLYGLKRRELDFHHLPPVMEKRERRKKDKREDSADELSDQV